MACSSFRRLPFCHAFMALKSRTSKGISSKAPTFQVKDRSIISSFRLFSTLEEDTQGRRIRRKSTTGSSTRPLSNDDSWNDGGNNNNRWVDNNNNNNNNDRDDNGWGAPSRKAKWNDDDNDGWDANYIPKPRASRSSSSPTTTTDYRRRNRGSDRSSREMREFRSSSNPSRDRRPRTNNDYKTNRKENHNNNNNNKASGRPINMNALEDAGFVHLYGLSSVLNALRANRRDFTTTQERGIWEKEEEEEEQQQQQRQYMDREPPKPQAQFRPYLFVQEQQQKGSTRKGQKASDADEAMSLAEERNIPVAQVDKGILNTLSGNRPHQGFVLRCGKIFFESMSRIPKPNGNTDVPSIWLVLDEVVDPQNLGALLRSAHFLGQGKLGVLVCSKNSAPPTAVVSAASAGALELATIYSTTNLPRTLNQANDDGFRIIGASSAVPNKNEDDLEFPQLYDLQELPMSVTEDDRPVLLVLGSEGHGLRTLVAKACTEFVRIPSGMDGSTSLQEGVDSLNVSVTGGILLWQLLNRRNK